MNSFMYVDFKPNQKVFGHFCDTNATNAPVGIYFLANHYSITQAPQLGKTDGCFSPLGACIELSSTMS